MLNSLKSRDLNALPTDVQAAVLAAHKQISSIVEQNAALTETDAALTTQVGELEALNARLEHFVKELNQVIYGTRSEKLTEDER
ncbi:MAG: transposase [Yoonia sp.]|jgi:transposase